MKNKKKNKNKKISYYLRFTDLGKKQSKKKIEKVKTNI